MGPMDDCSVPKCFAVVFLLFYFLPYDTSFSLHTMLDSVIASYIWLLDVIQVALPDNKQNKKREKNEIARER